MLQTEWIKRRRNNIGTQSTLDDYFIISNDTKLLPSFKYPIKISRSTVIICSQGSLRFSVDMKEIVCSQNTMAIIMPDTTYQFISSSDDFRGWVTILSEELESNILSQINQRQTVVMSSIDQPLVRLDDEQMEDNASLCEQLIKLSQRNNPNIKEIVTHMILAFYYMQHPLPTERKSKPISNAESVFDDFISLVGKNFKKERKVAFYASNMALTPKYLAKVIKDHTGRTANDWIDAYVMLEAKALLRSSRLTMQQIADRLSFPDQSGFGKYFKSHEGVSPKMFRDSNDV